MRERGPSGMLWRTGGGPSYPLGPLGLWEGRVRPGAPMASVPPPICSVLEAYFPAGFFSEGRLRPPTHTPNRATRADPRSLQVAFWCV